MSVWTMTLNATPPERHRANSSVSTDGHPDVRVGSAVLGRVFDAEQAQLTHAREEFAGYLSPLLPFVDVGGYFVLDEASDEVAEHVVFGGEGHGLAHGRNPHTEPYSRSLLLGVLALAEFGAANLAGYGLGELGEELYFAWVLVGRGGGLDVVLELGEYPWGTVRSRGRGRRRP